MKRTHIPERNNLMQLVLQFLIYQDHYYSIFSLIQLPKKKKVMYKYIYNFGMLGKNKWKRDREKRTCCNTNC